MIIDNLPLLRRGKVRDIYAVGEKHILIVASDRLSCFDIVLPDEIPGKGAILTRISNFWFDRTRNIVRNHLSGVSIDDALNGTPVDENIAGELHARSVVAKKLTPLPLEAIVRGYLAGSGWKDYCATGTICGIALPARLQLGQPLPRPLFTPSTKATDGGHDINLPFARVADLIGKELAEKVRETSLEIYRAGAAYALERNLIVADTKFEFGVDEDGDLVLIDEVLTPDSSRFWPREQHRTGVSPPGLDKQFVRDYLEASGWDKRPPGPRLPQRIIDETAQRYRRIQSLLLDEG